MDDFHGTPLDEIQWRLPEAIEFFGGITPENIHLYFMASPFCDPMSNNKMLENQAKFNPDINPILANRADFERRLREMNGLEYMIVDGPQHMAMDINPVWTIRKHRRTKNRGALDQVDILATYYAVGEHIYQAPSFADVLCCRLVCN
jgi:mediator of RNA polymerase II transcription subunit 6